MKLLKGKWLQPLENKFRTPHPGGCGLVNWGVFRRGFRSFTAPFTSFRVKSSGQAWVPGILQWAEARCLSRSAQLAGFSIVAVSLRKT
jgi:hypothetical protein